MLKKTRRIAAAAVVLPAVLAFAACGKSETPSTAGSSSGTSASQTSDAPASDHYADKASFIAAMKDATKDLKSAHVSMDMKAGSQGSITMEGDVVTDATNPAMQITMDMPGMGNIEMIYVDKTIYMKGMPGVGAGKWVSMDENSAVGKQMQGSLDQADPRKMYDDMETALKDVKFVATETVDGEEMDKYELSMDSSKIEGLDASGVKVPDTITYFLWLDSKDQMRKVTFEFSGIEADMTMGKYNEPVDIKAPAAGDVTPMPGS